MKVHVTSRDGSVSDLALPLDIDGNMDVPGEPSELLAVLVGHRVNFIAPNTRTEGTFRTTDSGPLLTLNFENDYD